MEGEIFEHIVEHLTDHGDARGSVAQTARGGFFADRTPEIDYDDYIRVYIPRDVTEALEDLMDADSLRSCIKAIDVLEEFADTAESHGWIDDLPEAYMINLYINKLVELREGYEGAYETPSYSSREEVEALFEEGATLAEGIDFYIRQYGNPNADGWIIARRSN